jgi:hypothetical protein
MLFVTSVQQVNRHSKRRTPKARLLRWSFVFLSFCSCWDYHTEHNPVESLSSSAGSSLLSATAFVPLFVYFQTLSKLQVTLRSVCRSNQRYSIAVRPGVSCSILLSKAHSP